MQSPDDHKCSDPGATYRYRGLVARDKAFRSGRFWLPGAPEKAVGGWLDLSNRWPLLTLADPLIPSRRELSRTTSADGRVFVTVEPTEGVQPSDGRVIHGMLRGPSRRITLVGLSDAGRSEVIGGVVHDPGEQRFRAEYMLMGPHQSGPEAKFTMARLQLRHLDSWAVLPGIAMELSEDWGQITARYERQAEESVPVADGAKLSLSAEVTLREPTLYGAGFQRSAELWLDDPTGLTVTEWWRHFVAPMSELLTMTVGASCPPVALKLHREGTDEWIELHHPLLEKADGAPALRPHEVFLTRKQLTLDHLAAWLAVSVSVAPIPALVAETINSPSRPLPSQLAEMAIAAEGLHRRLSPEARVMTRNQKNRARRRAAKAVSPLVRERVREALGHIEAPSYMERLRYLTDLTCEAIPDATRPDESHSAAGWEQRIKQVRNGFAHQSPVTDGDIENDTEWREQVVLLRTLYWVLATALLTRTGLDSSQIRTRTQSYEPYRALVRKARLWIPDVYAPTTVDVPSTDLSEQTNEVTTVHRLPARPPEAVGWRWRP
ncbi:hypothetical protein PW035_38595 [Nonomuraea angiospora]|nr:hypothetical protein [Nonomuraea angiospora]